MLFVPLRLIRLIASTVVMAAGLAMLVAAPGSGQGEGVAYSLQLEGEISPATSAGMYITQAADVAAMAPQTNIGSATPISIGPGSQDEVLGRKIRNDAAAYVRALADAHGRNPRLGERMVRQAENVTAEEALTANFIDVVAGSEE